VFRFCLVYTGQATYLAQHLRLLLHGVCCRYPAASFLDPLAGRSVCYAMSGGIVVHGLHNFLPWSTSGQKMSHGWKRLDKLLHTTILSKKGKIGLIRKNELP
jgi:hypothetical protein